MTLDRDEVTMPNFDAAVWARIKAHRNTKLNPGTQPEEIASLEQSHNVRLPDSYREFLLKANGGFLGKFRLFGIARGDSLDLDQQITEMQSEMEETSQGPVLPFASDWGGSYFCFDLRQIGPSSDHPVLYWDHEYTEEPDWSDHIWSGFADNFVDFVEKAIEL
jgi:hypothetical protein